MESYKKKDFDLKMATKLSAFISKLKLYQPIGTVRRPEALQFINDYSRFISSLENINNMIGLDLVKDQVTEQVQSFIVNYRRFGKPTNGEMLHTLIYGPPGCGKTQLGENLAELWAASGCLPQDDGTVLFPTQPNAPAPQNQMGALQQLLQADTEKNSLRQSLILKDVQIRQLQEKIRNTNLTVGRILTQFNNARKKVKAKIDSREPQIQSKFQEIKEEIKGILGDSAHSSPNSESSGSEKNGPEILPVTIPKNPGVRSFFGQSQPPLMPHIPSVKKPEPNKTVKFVRLTRGDLVAKYQGHTTDHVRKLLSKYVGGVVMIDEAYNLCTSNHDDFGKELLTEIINFMTTWPDKIIFIFAGYRKDMEESVLKFQQGLNRRFNWTFEISEYSSLELSQIFQHQIQLKYPNRKITLSLETLEKMNRLFEENKSKFPHFGGDTERFCNFLKEVINGQYWERALDETVTSEEYHKLFEEITMETIELAFQKYLKNSVREREEESQKREEEKHRHKYFGMYS